MTPQATVAERARELLSKATQDLGSLSSTHRDAINKWNAQDELDAMSTFAEEITRLSEENARPAKAMTGDPDAAIALIGELHARAMDAEQRLAEIYTMIASYKRGGDVNGVLASDTLDRIATLATAPTKGAETEGAGG